MRQCDGDDATPKMRKQLFELNALELWNFRLVKLMNASHVKGSNQLKRNKQWNAQIRYNKLWVNEVSTLDICTHNSCRDDCLGDHQF